MMHSLPPSFKHLLEFITVSKELEVSDSYAYRLIRQLNAELEQKGFVVVKGKISRKYFEERVYGMNEMK